MRRVFLITAVAVTGLIGAGIAVAALSDSGTTKVAPTFTLTTSSSETAKCDGDDGAYTSEELSASGRITGGPLAGTADLDLTWVKNTTKNAGYAQGTLVVSADDTEKVRADVIGAVSGTTLRGTVAGTVGEDAADRLVGTISVARNGKSLLVKIGSGTLAGGAVVVGENAVCKAPTTVTGDVFDLDLESGYLSIETEDGDYVTIDLTEKQAAAIETAGIEVGDTVKLTYIENEDGSTELVKIERA